MPKDLRTFLQELEKAYPNDIVVVRKETDPKFEVTDIQYKLEQQLKYPVLIFMNIKNLKGEKSKFPLLTSIYVARRRMALALNTTSERLSFEYSKREKHPIQPQIISKKEAPVKQVIKKGENVDLYNFPVPTHSYMDGGPYITHGIVATTDFETGKIYNNAFHRLQIKGPRKMGIFMNKSGGTYLRYVVYEANDEPMPVAVWLGHHPAANMGALTTVPLEIDENPIIGGVLGEPLRVTSSEVCGDKMMVPADSEIIIEGYLLPKLREPEGPFGDYTGHQGPQRYGAVIEVKTITYRKDAYFPDIWPASRLTPEDQGAIIPAREAMIFEEIKRVVRTVKNVHVIPSGFRFIVYVQIKKTAPGQGKLALMTALAAHPTIKYAVAVDDDVNIFSDAEVLWAIGTRSQPDRDVFIVQNCAGIALDPSAKTVLLGENMFALTSKMGIDATKPVEPEPWPMRMKIPDEITVKIKLEDYIPEETIKKILPGLGDD